MKKTFLICSLHGRISNLIKLITSLEDYAESWNLCLVLQQYPIEERAIIQAHSEKFFHDNVSIFAANNMTGPHLARCIALDNLESDIWCILDDDMFAIKGMTHYDTMANILWNNPKIGILSSNWRRTEGMVRKVSLKDSIVKQDVVYTGGGMMIRSDVAEIIKSIPRTQYLFDNPLWSIYSYVNGYDNYRYLGSIAVHEICTKGGRRKWIKENDKNKSLPPAEWIKTRRGKGAEGSFDEYLICDSNDITELAKELHSKRRK